MIPRFHSRAPIMVLGAVFLQTALLFAQGKNIHIYDNATGRVRQITHFFDYDADGPAWSPDGASIAFGIEGGPSVSDHDLLVVELETGVVATLLTEEAYAPAWSPDGEWIAFDRDDTGIFVMPATGGEPRLVRAHAVEPEWSPDSKSLAFIDLSEFFGAEPACNGSPSETIRAIHLEDSSEVLVACGASFGEGIGGDLKRPRWSPDGGWLAFIPDELQDSIFGIWRIPVDEKGRPLGAPLQIVNDISADHHSWSSDSPTILYAAGDAEQKGVDFWTVPAAGGTPTRFYGQEKFNEQAPAFARDSHLVAFLARPNFFTEVMDGDLASDQGLSVVSNWVDYDSDGDLDLYVVNWEEENFLYRNDGGAFTKIVNNQLVAQVSNSHNCAWGDFDNDGNIDLFVSNWGLSQPNFLFKNNGGGAFERIIAGEIVTETSLSHGAAWADYNNDGHLDLFVATRSGRNNLLYRNNGNGDFTKVTTGGIVSDGGNSFGCSWADYDNDGLVDLFVANGGWDSEENNFLYRNEGGGAFTRILTGDIANDGGKSFGGSWGDYDNDGDLDLFVPCDAPDVDRLYENQGNGAFRKVTAGALVESSGNTHFSSWVDFDNDGDLDLLEVKNRGRFALFINKTNGVFLRLPESNFPGAGGSPQGFCWGDYDRDGDLDLFLSRHDGINNGLFQNNGNGNNWINIRCRGVESNANAIGAKVRVKAVIGGLPTWQLMEISGQTGGGLGSQTSVRAAFGLRDATTVDSIRIEWPSGQIWDTTEVSINQFLDITEKASSTGFPNTFVVSNVNDMGIGSLRQAILDANSKAGTDTIIFDIQGAGPHTIQPRSAFPVISDPIVIDGLTQPGSNGDAWPPVLLIELDGTNAAAAVDGLHITAGNSMVVGLVINRFKGDGIEMRTNGGNVVQTNFIGPNVTGVADLGNAFEGVFINGVGDNTIGGTTAGERNLVSGNKHGVFMQGGGATGNLVLGNFIGTDVNGVTDFGNSISGVTVTGGANTTIGGPTAGAGNLISGNDFAGVNIFGGSGHLIQGNFIGTDVTGSATIPNSVVGIALQAGVSNSTVGGVEAGAGNLISGNGNGNEGGVTIISGSHSNLVQGNFIGTDVSGTLDLGNNGPGVYTTTHDNRIGGTTTGARNIISGNTGEGIRILGAGASNNLVHGNFIGTDTTGAVNLGNGAEGVLINNAPDNTIGGSTFAARNLISGNGASGIVLSGSGAASNKVLGNFIGTDGTGVTAIANDGSGIAIERGASNNTIGGLVASAGNIISGNKDDGIRLSGATTIDNRILRNAIFTNQGSGIDLDNSDQTTNDAGDADVGPNNLQNYPVIVPPDSSASTELTILYLLDSDPVNSAYPVTVQFFKSDGAGEGALFIGEDVYSDSDFIVGQKGVNLGSPTELQNGGFLVATATDANGNTSEFSAQVEVDSLAANSFPVIETSAIAAGEAGVPVTVSAVVTDISPVESVVLNFREGGQASFQALTMTRDVAVYQATIPAASVGANGLEYYVQATNDLSNSSRTTPQAIQVRLPEGHLSRLHPSGAAGNAYRLISLPLNLDNPAVSSVLLDDLGPPDSLKWRLWDIDPQNRDSMFPYREYPAVGSLAAGKAAFLIAAETKILTAGTGLTIDIVEPFKIDLAPGWNMVASPFNFEIPIEQVQPESIRTHLYSYEGSWSSSPAALNPWQGYMIKVDSPTALTIDSSSDASAVEALAGRTGRDAEWAIRVVVTAGDAVDRDNSVGVFPDAAVEWDRHERFEPPPIGEFVMLSLPHRGWRRPDVHTTDFRPPERNGHTWDFEVETSRANQVGVLAFENLASIPAEFSAALVDLDLEVERKLTATTTYTFRTTQFRRPRHFRLLVGTDDYLQNGSGALTPRPESIQLEQNFPNPFNPVTSIRFGLPESRRVSLTIFNIVGQEVARLFEGEEMTAGRHVVVWEGRDQAGQPAPSGVYLYQLRMGPTALSRKMVLLR